jgi:hypothetical protein
MCAFSPEYNSESISIDYSDCVILFLLYCQYQCHNCLTAKGIINLTFTIHIKSNHLVLPVLEVLYPEVDHMKDANHDCSNFPKMFI